MTNRHSIEITSTGHLLQKLFIDGHDLSNFTGEVRIVLAAGKVPQVQVNLVPLGGLSVKLEEAGLAMAVKAHQEKPAEDTSAILRDIQKQLYSLVTGIADDPPVEVIGDGVRLYTKWERDCALAADEISGMHDPRK